MGTDGAKGAFEFLSKQANEAAARVQSAKKKSPDDPRPPSETASESKQQEETDDGPLPRLEPRAPPVDALVLSERELDWYERHARQMMSRFERTKYYKKMQQQLSRFR